MSTKAPRARKATATPIGTGSRFRDRLGIYLTGVAIGFAILGMLWMARSRATRQNAAASATSPMPPASIVTNPALAPGATSSTVPVTPVTPVMPVMPGTPAKPK